MPESFEDKIDIINNEISKRKNKWRLDLKYMDFDDVKQIIKIHIYNKWEQWDQSLPLEPWLNVIIIRQIKNLIRDHHYSFVKPCDKCALNEGENQCREFITQCNKCKLYAKWEKTKKNKYNIKKSSSIDIIPESNIDKNNEKINEFNGIGDSYKKLNIFMKKSLSNEEYKIYETIYIKNESDSVVNKILKLDKNSSKSERYRQLNKYKKYFSIKAKEILKNEDIL